MMSEEKNKISWNDRIVNFVSDNIVWLFLGFILVVIILPKYLLDTSLIGYIPFNINEEQTSSVINNLTAPIIGLFSAFLVYIAFREQKKANEELQKFNDRDTIIKELSNLFHLVDRLRDKVNKLTLVIDKNNPQLTTNGIESISRSLSKEFIPNTNYKNTNLTNYYSDCIDLYSYLCFFVTEINNSKLSNKYKEYFLNDLKQYYNFLDYINIQNNSTIELDLFKLVFDNKMDEYLYEISYNKLLEKINQLKNTFPKS